MCVPFDDAESVAMNFHPIDRATPYLLPPSAEPLFIVLAAITPAPQPD